MCHRTNRNTSRIGILVRCLSISSNQAGILSLGFVSICIAMIFYFWEPYECYPFTLFFIYFFIFVFIYVWCCKYIVFCIVYSLCNEVYFKRSSFDRIRE